MEIILPCLFFVIIIFVRQKLHAKTEPAGRPPSLLFHHSLTLNIRIASYCSSYLLSYDYNRPYFTGQNPPNADVYCSDYGSFIYNNNNGHYYDAIAFAPNTTESLFIT